jgi:calcium/calmodulin-dependent 3',5'-cyclic nucleotide phosphodiesterase
LQETSIPEEIENYYKMLKNQYINTHSLLINDNIADVTTSLVKNLINCDSYSFITTHDGIYESVK